MKKTITVLLCIFLFTRSFSQESKVFIGLQAGVSSAKLRSNGVNDARSLTGFQFSGTIGMHLSPHWSIVASPGYERSGSIDSSIVFLDGIPVGGGNITNSIHYLTIPVAVQYSFGKKIKLLVNAGGFTGFRLDAKAKGEVVINGPGLPGGTEHVDSNIDYIRTMNWGVTFGAGLQMPLNKRLYADFTIRDNLGLYPMNTHNNSVRTNIVEWKLGVIYPLKHKH